MPAAVDKENPLQIVPTDQVRFLTDLGWCSCIVTKPAGSWQLALVPSGCHTRKCSQSCRCFAWPTNERLASPSLGYEATSEANVSMDARMGT